MGFGNYSTLVAAQWANSTSHYDVHHATLYTSRCSQQVLGGNAIGQSGEEDGWQEQKRLRVPRLVLFDAPCGTLLESFDEIVQKEEERREKNKKGASDTEEEENSSGVWGSSRAPPLYEMECLSPSKRGGTAPSSSSRLRQRRQVLQNMLQRAPWEWRSEAAHSLVSDDDDEEVDEEEVSDTFSKRSTQGATGGATTFHTDPQYGQLSEDTRTPHFRSVSHRTEERLEEAEEEEKEEVDHDGKERKRKREFKKRHGAMAKAKKMVFSSSLEQSIPWWHYISTGLASDAVINLRPPQHADAASAVAACHSFGYGLAHLKDSGAAATVEMEHLTDSLRRQLEDAHAVQGVQCFVDADGLFGGAAYNTLESFWEDAGSKVPAAVAAIFSPLPPTFHASPFVAGDTVGVQDANDGSGMGPGFTAQRREEQVLNRLLATTMLSRHSSAVYIPIELTNFSSFFSSPFTSPPSWLADDRATAQLLAACMDTALYGTRDGGMSSGSAMSSDGGSRPAFFLHEWARTIRPVHSLRVAAMMGALPVVLRETLPSTALKELSQWMEDTPLLGPTSAYLTRQLLASPYENVEHIRQAVRKGEVDPGNRTVGGTGSSGPGGLLGQFISLSHAMEYSPLEPQGRVLGHAVSVRGAGVLPSTKYPLSEALCRYAAPLRTSTFLPLITKTNLPVSHTFPMSLLYGGAAHPARNSPVPHQTHQKEMEKSFQSEGSGQRSAMQRELLDGVDCGAHVLSTYASAEMLKNISTEAENILLPRHHSPYLSMHQSLYEMEEDDWREVVEEARQIFDDYHHAPPQDSEEEEEW